MFFLKSLHIIFAKNISAFLSADCAWDSFACWRDVDLTFGASGDEGSCCQQRFEECCKYVMDPEAYEAAKAAEENEEEEEAPPPAEEQNEEEGEEKQEYVEPEHADTLSKTWFFDVGMCVYFVYC